MQCIWEMITQIVLKVGEIHSPRKGVYGDKMIMTVKGAGATWAAGAAAPFALVVRGQRGVSIVPYQYLNANKCKCREVINPAI